jgi:hypothetical protein
MNEETPREPGRRKDGKPFKEGNTREDGSYEVGRNRTSESTKFAVNDGRVRGRRVKGTKNLMTEWREELSAKITIVEGGKPKKVSKRRALIKAKIDRGIKKSDRANETALRYAQLSEKREPGLQADDLAIVAAWLAAQQIEGDTDDADQVDGIATILGDPASETSDED